MPVIIRQLPPNANGQPRHAHAVELARQCVDQYQLNRMPGPGGGIGPGSCWAAVAVNPGEDFRNLHPIDPNGAAPAGGGVAVGGGLGFGVSFGNSRVANVNAHVPVPGYNGGGHAERVAINNLGGLENLHLVNNDAVLFVQLHPCGPGGHNCRQWLDNLALDDDVNLNVYYRWNHPAGVDDMTNWNQQTRAQQQADINNW